MKEKNKKRKNGLGVALNRKKLGSAVKEKRLQEGMSLRDLEEVVGVSFPTLDRIEGGKTDSPKSEHLLALCQWLNMPPESFYTGVSAMRARKHYLTYVNAGLPAPTSDEFEYRDLSEYLMPDRDDYFTVTAKGDSMIEAQIHDGDLLIVRRSETANPGDIVVAVIDGEYCVKIFDPKGDSIILRSANPEYSPLTVKEGLHFYIRGVVTYSVHKPNVTGATIR